jgi:hypothetical protein
MSLYREIIWKPPAIFWLAQQEGHTLLASICTTYVWIHGVVDRPATYTHCNFSSVSSQQIFDQLLWSELMCYVPVNQNPKPLFYCIKDSASHNFFFVKMSLKSYTLKWLFMYSTHVKGKEKIPAYISGQCKLTKKESNHNTAHWRENGWNQS